MQQPQLMIFVFTVSVGDVFAFTFSRKTHPLLVLPPMVVSLPSWFVMRCFWELFRMLVECALRTIEAMRGKQRGEPRCNESRSGLQTPRKTHPPR